MFNLTSVITNQTIHLCGMLTEAVHTPLLGDRALSIENARYIMNTARHLSEELLCVPEGKIQTRAAMVLREAHALLNRIAQRGLMESIEDGVFADVKRTPQGGRGSEGVFARAFDYWNPFEEALQNQGIPR
jgi:beta-lysine 5,6-aminomutase alpha subunit